MVGFLNYETTRYEFEKLSKEEKKYFSSRCEEYGERLKAKLTSEKFAENRIFVASKERSFSSIDVS